MLNVADILLNILLKKGLIAELKNFQTEITIEQTRIVVKADNLEITVFKEEAALEQRHDKKAT